MKIELRFPEGGDYLDRLSFKWQKSGKNEGDSEGTQGDSIAQENEPKTQNRRGSAAQSGVST